MEKIYLLISVIFFFISPFGTINLWITVISLIVSTLCFFKWNIEENKKNLKKRLTRKAR